MAVYYSPLMEKLKAENDELKEHVEELKQQLEQEKIKLKHTKDDRVNEIRVTREQEQADAAVEREELKQKLQRQMQTDVLAKIDEARKDWDIQMATLKKSHKQELDDLSQKYENEMRQSEEKKQLEKTKFKEEMLADAKREKAKFAAEAFKLEEQLATYLETIDNLKIENKNLKSDLQKEISKNGKEAERTDHQNRAIYQKQIEELREKDRLLSEKDRHLSELRRKCTSLEVQKEKLEIDLQVAKKLRGTTPPPSTVSATIHEGEEKQAHTSYTKTHREEELLITNSELGVLVKRLRNELQHLKKDKAIVDDRLRTAEELVEPLKKRREEDMRQIQELNHMVTTREKQRQKLANEKNELKEERDKLAKELGTARTSAVHLKVHDKRDSEIAKLKKLLAAKSKEFEELQEDNAKLNLDLIKIRESMDQVRKEKAETRMKQLTSTGPSSPAVERKVKEHRRLVELERIVKEKTEEAAESKRSEARMKQRMEDTHESLKRRDKRIKTLTNENHKLKSANQFLEEARDRTHRETINEWDRTRSELERAHAQINRLQQENMDLLDELEPNRRSRSRNRHNASMDRARSHSPGGRVNAFPDEMSLSLPSHGFKLLSSGKQPSPAPNQLSPPVQGLRPTSPGNQPQMRIPIATHYVQRTSPSRLTPPQYNYSSPISPDPFVTTSSPLPRSSSPLVTSTSPPFDEPVSPRRLVINIPQVTIDQTLDNSLEELGSEISLESLKDKIELYEFEKEESKIQQDEQKEIMGKLLGKYNVLKERYNSLLVRSKDLRSQVKLANQERLEVDGEVARLLKDRHGGREFDVKREDSLREQLNKAHHKVKELEAEKTTLMEEKEEAEQMTAQLAEQMEQLEHQVQETQTLLLEKETATNEMKQILENALAGKEKEMDELQREKDDKLKTMERQLNEMETGLAAMEGELEGEKAMVASLRQQKVEAQLPRRLAVEPQVISCISSAQNVAKEVKKNMKPKLSDEQLKQVQGLTEYIYQVLEEAKGHVTAPTVTTTTTTVFDDTDDAEVSEMRAESVPLATQRTTNTAQTDEITQQVKNKAKKNEEMAPVLTTPSTDVHVHHQLQKQYKKREQSMISQMNEMQSQITASNEREVTLRKLVDDLEERLTKELSTGGNSEKDEWFKQWMMQFENEKKSLKKRIKELETRLGEGSQRVFDLQSLVMELEGRIANEKEDLSRGDVFPSGGEVSPSVLHERDEYIVALTEQVSELKQKLVEGKSTPPISLGLDVTKLFQLTQKYLERGDLNLSRKELRKLEKAISKLLREVYPNGLQLAPSINHVQPSAADEIDYQDSWGGSPVPPQLQVTPSSPAHQHPSVSLSMSPITPLSSSEGDLIEEYTPTTPASKGKGMRLFVTLLDYNPLSLCSTGHPERELTLRTGDVISVIGDMNSDGFYSGIFEGRKGLVPAKFLEEMTISDKDTQHRLLNQSMASPGSLHGSDFDITSTYSSHSRLLTSTMIPASSTATSHVPRPSPPSHLYAQISGDCLVVTWRTPNVDSEGRSNGYLVTGYTIKCDDVIHRGVGDTNRFTKRVMLEEVDPYESHVISICTQSNEGQPSTEIAIQYSPPSTYHDEEDDNEQLIISRHRQKVIRSSQRSEDSVDSDIMKTKPMVASMDYTPSTDSPNVQPELELKFTKGQVITIYGDMRDDGFYHGELGGRFGLVPSNYVDDLEYSDDMSDTTQPSPTNDVSMATSSTSPAHTDSQERNNGSKRKLFTTHVN